MSKKKKNPNSTPHFNSASSDSSVSFPVRCCFLFTFTIQGCLSAVNYERKGQGVPGALVRNETRNIACHSHSSRVLQARAYTLGISFLSHDTNEILCRDQSSDGGHELCSDRRAQPKVY